jgi:hypothetical protein
MFGPHTDEGQERRARLIFLAIIGTAVLLLVVLGVVAWHAVRPDDPRLPKSEQQLVNAVARAKKMVDGTPVAQVQARRDRRLELCAPAPAGRPTGDRLRVASWVGTIQDIDTPLGGDEGTFRLVLAEGLSLVQDRSVPGGGVPPGTEVYKDLARLHDGDRVRFSGKLVPDRKDCFAERSFRLSTSLKSPTFELRLQAIDED